MTNQPDAPVSTTSLTMLKPFLAAFDPFRRGVTVTSDALPRPCRLLGHLRTIVCATPIITPARFQGAMLTMSWRHDVDIVVIRHGAHPEILDAVAVDVTIGRWGPAQIFWDVVPFRAADGGLWLVPPPDQVSRSLHVSAAGLVPTSRPPYRDRDERMEGVGRAARETVLALRRS